LRKLCKMIFCTFFCTLLHSSAEPLHTSAHMQLVLHTLELPFQVFFFYFHFLLLFKFGLKLYCELAKVSACVQRHAEALQMSAEECKKCKKSAENHVARSAQFAQIAQKLQKSEAEVR